MNYSELKSLSKKLFTVDDIARQYAITRDSAKVTASRYVRRGIIMRLKKNTYIVTDAFDLLSEVELFSIANILQVPSYISLTSALGYYNITTQQLRNTIEAVAIKRSYEIGIRHWTVRFIKVKRDFYCGFVRENNIFIATPEKALADAVYLTSIGRYRCDFHAIDFKKMKMMNVAAFIETTNDRTRKFWDLLCATFKL